MQITNKNKDEMLKVKIRLKSLKKVVKKSVFQNKLQSMRVTKSNKV